MKKFFLALIIACMSLFVLAACGPKNPDEPSKGDDTTNGGTTDNDDKDKTEPEETIYDKLNAMAKKSASTVNLTVTTRLSGETLTSKYTSISTAEGVVVSYSIEKFNKIETAQGAYVLPDAAKSTLTGSMTVKDGKIVKQDGAPADITAEASTATGLTFAEASFTNVKTESGKFSASVSKPGDFLGQTITCTGMTVAAEYSGDAFTRITITYTADAEVTILYTFS